MFAINFFFYVHNVSSTQLLVQNDEAIFPSLEDTGHCSGRTASSLQGFCFHQQPKNQI